MILSRTGMMRTASAGGGGVPPGLGEKIIAWYSFDETDSAYVDATGAFLTIGPGGWIAQSSGGMQGYHGYEDGRFTGSKVSSSWPYDTISMSLWIKMGTGIVNSSSLPQVQQVFDIRVSGSDITMSQYYSFNWRDPVVIASGVAGSGVSTGWNHLAISASPTFHKAWFNGVGITGIVPTSTNSPATRAISMRGNDDNPMSQIHRDESCFANELWTDDDAEWLYNSGLGRRYTDL